MRDTRFICGSQGLHYIHSVMKSCMISWMLFLTKAEGKNLSRVFIKRRVFPWNGLSLLRFLFDWMFFFWFEYCLKFEYCLNIRCRVRFLFVFQHGCPIEIILLRVTTNWFLQSLYFKNWLSSSFYIQTFMAVHALVYIEAHTWKETKIKEALQIFTE